MNFFFRLLTSYKVKTSSGSIKYYWNLMSKILNLKYYFGFFILLWIFIIFLFSLYSFSYFRMLI